MAQRRGFLHEIVDERSRQNPEFLDLVQAALEHRAARPERAAAQPDRRPTRASARSATGEPQSRRRFDTEALEEQQRFDLGDVRCHRRQMSPKLVA
jgi:hypothetical protein